jgi:hypothetical protein
MLKVVAVFKEPAVAVALWMTLHRLPLSEIVLGKEVMFNVLHQTAQNIMVTTVTTVVIV